MARINIVNADNKIESNPRRAYFKLKNTGGPKGDTGAQGPQGPKGDTGAQGPAGLSASVTVGSTTTLAPGASATVTNSGDTRNAVLNFGIPTGAQGPQGIQGPKGDTGPEGAKGAKGDTGAAATVTVNATNTGAPGSNAEVVNLGDEHNALLQFTIPRGDKGETGSQGPQGEPGESFTPTVVTSLPVTGDPNAIYFTEKAHTTQTATGNPITATITDGAGKMEALQLDGDTFQQSYEGKNLFNKDSYPSIPAYISTSGKIVAGGGSLSIVYIPCEPNTTYTVSKTNAGENQRFCVFDTAEEPAFGVFVLSSVGTRAGTDTSTHYTITTGATATYLGVFIRVSATSLTEEQIVETIQIENGSTATDYEPYCGGQPSPNPDYPQPIQTVTGEQTVAVTGKNLFDKDYPTEHYYYDASGNKVTDNRNDWINQAIPLSEKLTFSFASKTGSNCYVRLVELNSGAFVKRTLVSTTGTTITLDASTTDIIASVDAGPTNYFTGLQIEAGSTATAYAPYSKQTLPLDLGAIELCKLGTYQDYIWKDGESWKVHNANGKTVITDKNARGSFQSSTDTSRFAFGGITPQGTPQGTNAELCSKLERKFNWNTDVQGFYANGSTIVARIAHGIVGNTEESFATWLESNPLTIYYALATATDTTITDAGLIAQLEAIRTALLQNGANTITNTATGSNLAGDMEIGYYGYTPSSQYDKWLWLDVGAAGAHYEQI